MLDLKTPPPLPRGPIRAQGLFWEGTPGADNLVGKFGGDAGANTFVAFDVAARRGVVMLTNRSPPDGLAQDMVKLAKAAVA
jgi:CubicO group peptidase (beta-lactamase class C family)